MHFRFTGLWLHAEFRKLWAGQTVSLFGSLVTRTALPFAAILVLQATPFQMSLLSAADLVAAFLVGLFAGVWVDRLRRRSIMIVADLGRAVLLGSIPAAAVFGLLSFAHLYVVAFGVGILTMFFDVAYIAYLPTLIPREDLVEGNSKLAATASVASVGSFGLGGWLVQLLTAPGAIFVDALSFVFSALTLWLIRTPEPPPAPKAERSGIWAEIGEGLTALARNPILRAVAGSVVTLEFCYGIFGTLFLLYASRELGFAPGLLGMIFAVGGVSSLLGAIAAGPLTCRFGLGLTLVLALLLVSLGQLLVPLAQGATVLAAALLVGQQLVGDGAMTVYEISQTSLRQTVTSDRLLGRVNASIRFLSLAMSIIGALASGVLGETIGLRPTIFIGVGIGFISLFWLLLSPVWKLREMPVADLGEAE
jgi:MFS family permease